MSEAKMSTLNVYWDTELTGRLTKIGGQDMSFQYSENYLESKHPQPISLSLPLQAEAFDAYLSKSWFANLLPEGDMRGHVARKLGVSERNDYAILDGIGGDCAGALRLLPESAQNITEGKLIPLPWAELEAKIASTPRPSLLALVLQEGELRLSLAGAQDKLPVHISNGNLALPSGHAASTHLLKISSGNFPDLVQNELFCLTLARKIGFNIPQAEMAATKTPILLIERYDRNVDPEGKVDRLHQEDFCQALGIPPESKYENEGGPSLALMFEALPGVATRPCPTSGNSSGGCSSISLLGTLMPMQKTSHFCTTKREIKQDLALLPSMTSSAPKYTTTWPRNRPKKLGASIEQSLSQVVIGTAWLLPSKSIQNTCARLALSCAKKSKKMRPCFRWRLAKSIRAQKL